MKVLNVNSTLGLKSGGGTAERTFQMSHHLAFHKIETTVLTLDIDLDSERYESISPARVVAIPCLIKRFYIPSLKTSRIDSLVKESDIIHLMGHWSLLNVLVYHFIKKYKKKYVVCPAGALPLYGRSKIIKKIFNFIIGYEIIKNANCWLAVTKLEVDQFLPYSVDLNSVKIIPNGINHKDFIHTNSNFLTKYKITNNPYILFMGRLNPIKGPDILLNSFVKIINNFPQYLLIFAGPDGGLLSKLKTQVQELDLINKVLFLGYLEGEDKISAYHFAKLLVVPSRQEAMSIVALEAGACETTTLMTDQCGLPEINEISSDLEVPCNEIDISLAIEKLLTNDLLLSNYSIKWKEFVIKNYSWEKIVNIYINLYKSLLNIN